MSERTEITRTIEEITASARVNMQDMVNRAIMLGRDLIDAKELLGHGGFLPWLEKIGISSSRAANYMKCAREIAPGSMLAALPYSKALALLSAPPEEREELAAQAQDKSAAELRRLISERDKAAEAANAETARADQAEADAKRFHDENMNLRDKMEAAEERIKYFRNMVDYANDTAKKTREEAQAREAQLRQENEKLRADILTAENNRVKVEVLPADYVERENMLTQAAADAEERAAAAEAELEALKREHGAEDTAEGGACERLHYSLKTFFLQCEYLAINPGPLMTNREMVRRDVNRLLAWGQTIMESLDGGAIEAEGTVSP